MDKEINNSDKDKSTEFSCEHQRQADSCSNDVERQADCGNNNSERQADCYSNSGERQADCGNNNSERQADSCSNDVERQADCGNNNSERQADSCSNDVERQMHCGINNMERQMYCGINNSKRQMDYNTFMRKIFERVKSEIHPELSKALYLGRCLKNNGKSYDVIEMRPEKVKGGSCSPLVYIEEQYTYYKQGVSEDKIIDDILDIFTIHSFSPPVLKADTIEDFDKVRGHIYIRLINYEMNRELLAGCPHEKILDLAMTCRIDFETMLGFPGTCLVNNSILRSWQITPDEILKTAKENTLRIMTPRLLPMGEMLSKISEGKYPAEAFCTSGLYVLTNTRGMDGAVLAFLTDHIHKMSEKCGRDIIILPSSIHEVILLADDGTEGTDYENLCEMVREINRSEVIHEEVLSDHIYRYDASTGLITAEGIA